MIAIKKHRIVPLIAAALQLLMLWAGGAASSEPAIDSAALMRQLQSGGYVLYVRHGQATIGQDRPGLTFGDCASQRNLDDAGREEALRFGQSLRQKSIPVAQPVLASPYCRTRQSAEIAFGARRVAADDSLAPLAAFSALTAEERQETLAHLNELLETPPPAGANRVIVAHALPAGIAVGEIPYMGTVVVKPNGPGRGYEIAGRLSLNDLTAD
ncbi:histidine phosphatase family protein [Paenibacillus humicola]|uniref:histidine phosphatase family protein n=1 Tax=Paenibacillus humicola TaxID=3110540 RepID=UPI00237B8E92|nr:histidine phosphatase family protein [Paenibacillus humicola]